MISFLSESSSYGQCVWDIINPLILKFNSYEAKRKSYQINFLKILTVMTSLNLVEILKLINTIKYIKYRSLN